MPSLIVGRSRLCVVGAIALLPLGLSACATTPQNPASASATPAASQQAQSATPEKKICRDVSTTGSYGPRHECHTASEWQKIDDLS